MRTLFLLIALILPGFSSQAQKPTNDDITKVLKATWENSKSSNQAKKTVTINSIKLGMSEKSNYAQQLEGVPKNAWITHAKIDFTQNTFYSNETQPVRRIMTVWVYRDQFGDWGIKNVGTVYP